MLIAAMPAAAADLYGRGPAFAAAPFNGYNWNGFYVGANLGYQWGSVTNWGGGSPSGITGGAQIGYNWQMSNWVFGFETDIQWANQRGSTLFTCPAAVVGCLPGLLVPLPAGATGGAGGGNYCPASASKAACMG